MDEQEKKELNDLVRNFCDTSDDEAFGKISRKISPIIWSVVNQFYGGTDPSREDAFQEIWLKILKSLGKYRYDGSFAAWCGTVARNYLINQKKRFSDSLYTPWSDSEGYDNLPAARTLSPDELAARSEDLRHLSEALEILSSPDREVAKMFYLEEMSAKQIAAATGKSHVAVHKQIERLRKKLQKEMNRLKHEKLQKI